MTISTKASLRALSMSDEVGNSIQVKLFNLNNYWHKEVHTRVDQFRVFNNRLWEINEGNTRHSFCNGKSSTSL